MKRADVKIGMRVQFDTSHGWRIGTVIGNARQKINIVDDFGGRWIIFPRDIHPAASQSPDPPQS